MRRFSCYVLAFLVAFMKAGISGARKNCACTLGMDSGGVSCPDGSGGSITVVPIAIMGEGGTIASYPPLACRIDHGCPALQDGPNHRQKRLQTPPAGVHDSTPGGRTAHPAPSAAWRQRS